MELFNHSNDIELKDTCSICLDLGNNDSEISICKQCGKGFHKKCIIEWIEKKESCPNCRFQQKDDFDFELMQEIIIFNEMTRFNYGFHDSIVWFYFCALCIKCLLIIGIVVFAVYLIMIIIIQN